MFLFVHVILLCACYMYSTMCKGNSERLPIKYDKVIFIFYFTPKNDWLYIVNKYVFSFGFVTRFFSNF